MEKKTIKYCSGYKYQLVAPYTEHVFIFPEKHIAHDFIILSTSGILLINSGYAWDGPSGPTIDTKNFMRGSLVHDALYQLMREGLLPESTREQADNELRRLCREDGMSWIRAYYVYRAVRRFGNSCAALSEDKIITAP